TRPVVYGRALTHLARRLGRDSRSAQTPGATRRPAFSAHLSGGRAAVRLSLVGGGGPLAPRSTGAARAGLRAAAARHAHRRALSPPVAALVGRPCGACA